MVNFLEEAAFLRKHSTNLEARVAAATEELDRTGLSGFYLHYQDMNDEYSPWTDYEYQTGIDFLSESVWRVFEEAKVEALADIIAAVGGKATKQLPDMPKMMLKDLETAKKLVKERGAQAVPAPSDTWNYRCGHHDCRRVRALGSIKYTRDDFLKHWHDTHAGNGLEAPQELDEDACVVRCGHYTCHDRTPRSFSEMRTHTDEKHCHVPKCTAYAPIVRLVTSAAYDGAETASHSYDYENEDPSDFDDPPSDY